MHPKTKKSASHQATNIFTNIQTRSLRNIGQTKDNTKIKIAQRIAFCATLPDKKPNAPSDSGTIMKINKSTNSPSSFNANTFSHTKNTNTYARSAKRTGDKSNLSINKGFKIILLSIIFIPFWNASIHAANPTGIINDIIDVQLTQVDQTFSDVIQSINRDFEIHVQNSFDVSPNLDPSIFSSQSTAWQNRTKITDLVDEIYINLGDFGWFSSQLSEVRRLVKNVQAFKAFYDDIKTLGSSAADMQDAAEELAELLQDDSTNKILHTAVYNKDPHAILSALGNSAKSQKIREELSKLIKSSNKLDDAGQGIIEALILATQGELVASLDLSSEAGKKIFIQNFLIKKAIEDDVISSVTQPYHRFFEVYKLEYTDILKRPFLTTWSNLGLEYPLPNEIGRMPYAQVVERPLPWHVATVKDDFIALSGPPTNSDLNIEIRQLIDDTPPPPPSGPSYLGALSNQPQQGSVYDTTTSFSVNPLLNGPEGAEFVDPVLPNDGIDTRWGLPFEQGGGTISLSEKFARGNYQYTDWGKWEENETTPTGYAGSGYWVSGPRTSPDQLALRTGSASFKGQMKGDYMSGGVREDAYGGIELLANFATDQISGQMQWGHGGAGTITGGPVSPLVQLNAEFGESGSFNQNVFGDTTTVPGSILNYGFSGVFIGPDASELGGTSYLSTSDGTYNGVFRALEQ